MHRAVLALAAVCGLLAVGSAAAATSPSAYLASESAMCKAGIQKLNAIPSPSGPSAYEAFFRANYTGGLALLHQLAQAEPPASLKPLMVKALYLQAKVVGGLKGLADQIAKGVDPTKAYNAAKPLLQSWTKTADAAWNKVGLPACTG